MYHETRSVYSDIHLPEKNNLNTPRPITDDGIRETLKKKVKLRKVKVPPKDEKILKLMVQKGTWEKNYWKGRLQRSVAWDAEKQEKDNLKLEQFKNHRLQVEISREEDRQKVFMDKLDRQKKYLNKKTELLQQLEKNYEVHDKNLEEQAIIRILEALMQSELSEECLDQAIVQLSAIRRNLQRTWDELPRLGHLADVVDSVLTSAENQKQHNNPLVGFYRPVQQRTRGRPLYVISRDQLLYFVESGFTTQQMAEMLNISNSSIKRRLRNYGISIRTKYSTLSDEDLDEKVQEIVKDNRNLGQKMVQAMLQSEGHTVQRERVATSLIRVDEAGVAMRWGRTIKRRTYKVSGPNALWHIDGNHKLIRWGFVIHGGIDGFSRLITFLRVSTNNAARTMTDAFMSGIESYGVPSRVRSDHGLENTGVGTFMLAYRGTGRGSFITGRSVHNQRIERLWRDLFQSCTNVFHSLFHHMENELHLDPSNDMMMWCLHYVFIPRIQRALDVFVNAWNNHGLRTEGGKTPKQLFIRGIHDHIGQGHRGVDDLVFEPPDQNLNVPDQEYGIEDEVIGTNDSQIVRNLSCRPLPISVDQLRILKELVNPLDQGNLELSAFEMTVDYVNSVNHL